MSYRHPYTRQFPADAFHVVYIPVPRTSPERCPEHVDPASGKSRGFRAMSSLSLLRNDQGMWRLVTPLDVPTEMPGQNPKLTRISIKGMIVTGFGTIGEEFEAQIAIEADGSDVLPLTKIAPEKDRWNINDVPLNIPLTGASKIDFRLWQTVTTVSGFIGLHVADVILSGEYYTTIPPPVADVDITVLNKATSAAVKNAHVLITDGAVVAGEGYTNSAGLASFPNIEEGTYSLKATAQGYNDAEQSITVTSPKVAYTLKLAPIPAEPLPWWVIPAAIGGTCVVAVGVLAALRRKPSFIVLPSR